MGFLFILKRIGFFIWDAGVSIFGFIVKNWRVVLPIIVLLIAGLYLRSCWNKHKAKLNEQQIVAAQQAIAKQDREEMTKILVEAEVAEKQIDANVVNASTATVNAQAEARKKANAMTNQELADYLNGMVEESK